MIRLVAFETRILDLVRHRHRAEVIFVEAQKIMPQADVYRRRLYLARFEGSIRSSPLSRYFLIDLSDSIIMFNYTFAGPFCQSEPPFRLRKPSDLFLPV